MARKVIWSFEATADLEAIADYIARDSSFYAASFVIEVRERVKERVKGDGSILTKRDTSHILN